MFCISANFRHNTTPSIIWKVNGPDTPGYKLEDGSSLEMYRLTLGCCDHSAKIASYAYRSRNEKREG